MATAAPRVCGLCGGLHAKGTRCPKAEARHKERKAASDAKRPASRSRGYGEDWRRLRADFLAVYPSCKRCGQPANTVDHIIRVKDAPHRRLDPSNLQALCTSCHSSAKQSEERRASKEN